MFRSCSEPKRATAKGLSCRKGNVKEAHICLLPSSLRALMNPWGMDQATHAGECTPTSELLSPGAQLLLGGCSRPESHHLEKWGGG